MAKGHVVRDLRFEVEFESQDQALDEQERLRAFAQGPALRIVEEAFDAALAPDEVLRLELLDIDLGSVEAATMEAQWAGRLRERLHEVLAEHRGAQRAAAPPCDAVQATADPLLQSAAASTAGDGADAQSEAPAAATWLTPAQAELETLLHFLAHGRHAWQSAAHTDPVALAARVWQHSAQELMRRLRALAGPGAQQSTVGWGGQSQGLQGQVQRLVRQFPGPWLHTLEAGLRGDAEASLLHPLSALSPPLPPWPASATAAEQRLHAALLVRAQEQTQAQTQPQTQPQSQPQPQPQPETV